jgi:uncharacterized protein
VNEAILFFAGAILGVYAVVVGGGMFFSVPLFQFLLPTASVGQIVGSIKVGSATRGLASTWTTWHRVRLREGLLLAVPFVIGATIGAYLISGIDQRWMLPIVVSAIVVSELAPRLHRILDRTLYRAAALVAGVYGGVLGAGLGVLIVALLRVLIPDESRIMDVKIQARFIEFIMGLAAITVHFWAGNLVTNVWLPWALGSFVGGALGGLLLNRLINVPAPVQRFFLFAAYAAALAGAGAPYFPGYR